MRRSAARLLVLSLVATGLLLVPSSAQGVGTPWSIIRRSGTAVFVGRGFGIGTATASCEADERVLSGFVTQSGSDDVRRLKETYGGHGYSVVVANQTGGTGSVTVKATVLCVPAATFSAAPVSAHGEFPVGDDRIGEGTTFCPPGYLAINASVDSSSTFNKTLLTTAPIANLTGWEVRGWDGGSASNVVTVDVTCVLASDVPGVKTYTHFDSGGWGAGASVDCAAGLVPITGGTVMFGGDSGAITINQQLTPTGLTSTTLDLSGGSMISTVVCLPQKVPSVLIIGPASDINATSLSWSFTVNDPAAAGGYSVTAYCIVWRPGDTGHETPCTSPVEVSDLVEGFYALSVRAKTSDGRISDFHDIVAYVDRTNPTVVFSDDPGVAVNSSSPGVAFTVDDARSVPTLDCWLDDNAPGSCGVDEHDKKGLHAFGLEGVTEGDHVLHVRAADLAGNSATYDLAITLDSLKPTVNLTSPSVSFQTALKVTVSWSGTDPNSGIATYQLRSRTATYNGAFGPYSTPIELSAGTTSRSFSGLVPGTTYCYSVRAVDAADNASEWSGDRCTGVPLDDRSLTKSKGWKSAKAKGWFKGTSVSTTKKGATLTKVARVKRIGVIAQKCSTCGVVGVYVGKHLVGKINLKAPKSRRATFVLPAFSLRKGTVKLKVLSSGKLVKIDAVGMSAA